MMVFRATCSSRSIFFLLIVFFLTASSAFAQLNEYFDGVTAPALPANWSSQKTGASPLWATSTTVPAGFSNFTPHTTPNIAFINDISTVSEASLFSPTLLFNGVDQLRFRHRFSLESTFDGGVLEISINGGAFQDIIAAGGSFAQGGYNGTISLNFSNPILGRQAWTGNNAGAPNYLQTVVNLPAAANNQQVQFRWRRGSDSSVAGVGWIVDSIELGQNRADLQISLTDSVDPVLGGTALTYTVTVTNNGPALAESVEAEQVVPPGALITNIGTVSQGTTTVPLFNVAQASFGVIPPGGSATLTVPTGVSFAVPLPAVFTISSPAQLARDYTASRIQFGPDPVTNSVTGNLVAVQDGNGDANDACQNLLNANAINGNIALLTFSGLCDLDEAVARSQGAGALGAVVVSGDTSLNVPFFNSFVVTIPAVMINAHDGGPILAFLPSTVPVTIGNLPGQLLSTAYVNSPTSDIVNTNNIAQQRTAFLNDTDGDSIPDNQDNCAALANLDQTNTDGDALGDVCDFCTDTDGDGAGNPEFLLNTCQLDACVSDPGKKFPGVCGCGAPDTDSDGDGTPNCKDACPFDGSTTAGVDANKNGILDCQKTPELKFRLNQVQTLVGKLNANFEGTSKAAKKQKKLRKDIGSLLKQVQAFVTGGGINGQNVQTLSASAISSVKKATKAKGKSFKKAKNGALTATANFIGSLGQ